MKKSRFLYMDMLKTICTMIMVAVHTFSVSEGSGMLTETFPAEEFKTVLGILYLIGPTIFMFCMGCSLVLTRKDSPKDYARRGLHLLFIGFILNVFRGFPLLAEGILVDREAPTEYLLWLISSDILFFAGLFFLFFALFKKTGLPDAVLCVTSLVIFILSLFIRVPVSGNDIAADILGNLIYVREDSYFPFMSWVPVPVLGYMFKKEYLRREDPSGFIKTVGITGLCVFAAVTGLLFITGSMQTRYFLWGETDFRMDLFPFIITLSVDCIFICLIWLLSGRIRSDVILRFAHATGFNLNRIYCIHWVILMNLLMALYDFTSIRFSHALHPLITAAAVFTVSALLAGKFAGGVFKK